MQKEIRRLFKSEDKYFLEKIKKGILKKGYLAIIKAKGKYYTLYC